MGEEIGTGRLIFRYAVGGTALLGEWLGSALRAIDELPAAPGEALPGAAPVVVRAGARTVLVGALSSAMRWQPPTTRLTATAREASRAARRGARLLRNVPGAALVRRRYASARTGVEHRLRRWAEEGAREEVAGRRLAHLATPSFFELAVARMSESPELRLVISEQSEGLAASSVEEIRARSEAADGAVERMVRRVLRRRRPRSGHA